MKLHVLQSDNLSGRLIHVRVQTSIQVNLTIIRQFDYLVITNVVHFLERKKRNKETIRTTE